MDARSLLRAKKAEGKVQDPHASYATSGQLKCLICAVPVKEWGAHVMTKQHRQSLTREKTTQSKSQSKRPATGDGLGESSKRPKTESEEVVRSSILPAGFFSNGSGPTIVAEDDQEEGEEEGVGAGAGGSKATTSKTASSAPAPASAPATTTMGPPKQTGDVELDDFLASLAEPDPENEPTPSAPSATPSTTAAKAKTPSVIKKSNTTYKDVIPGQASYEAAPVRNIPKDEESGSGSKEEVQEEESEAEKRARVAREEREEMMDRLDEETRAQEDADQRVAALKARMEALKKRREARPKAGAKSKNGKDEA